MAENDFGMGYAMGMDAGGGNRSGSDGFWGGDGVWGFLILALLFGGRGFGFGGGGFGGGGGGCGCETAVSNGFALNGLENGIRGIQQGLCDGFYAVNTGLLTGFNGIQSQLAQCCCETQRGIDSVKYDMATGLCGLGNTINGVARDIMENQNAGVRSILDFLTQDKISSLQAENQALKFQASQSAQNAFITANQEAQTAELIRRIAPMPVPSYAVPAPYPYCGSGYSTGGCGCGC